MTRASTLTTALALSAALFGFMAQAQIADNAAASAAKRTAQQSATMDPLPSYMLAPDAVDVPTASFSPMRDLDLSIGVRGDGCNAAGGAACSQTLDRLDPDQSVRVDARWQAGRALAFSLGFQTTSGELRHAGNDLSAAFGAAEDISLTCELVTEAWGELELGLRYSRWQSEEDGTEFAGELGRSAEIGLGWQFGAFRGDLKGRQLEGALGSSTPASLLDISFAWETPWNASLSVGARNVLNQRADDAIDAQAENLLGRVPYVRYQQDL